MPKRPWKRNGDGDVVISLKTVRLIATTIASIAVVGGLLGVPIFMRADQHDPTPHDTVTLRAEFEGHEKLDAANMTLILTALRSIDGRLANLEARGR